MNTKAVDSLAALTLMANLTLSKYFARKQRLLICKHGKWTREGRCFSDRVKVSTSTVRTQIKCDNLPSPLGVITEETGRQTVENGYFRESFWMQF